MYIIIRHDLFDRTVDAKRMKIRDSKETVRAFLTMISKKNWPKKICVDKEMELAGDFIKLFKAEGIQFYPTMSDTKVAFAERTIRSLRNILYCYMEAYDYKIIQKLSQFVKVLNSRRKCSTDLIPKNGKTSDFLSILYSKPEWEYRKPKFKIGDRVCMMKYDWPSRKGYKPQFKREVFENVTFSSSKNLQHTQQWMNRTRLSKVNFIKTSWLKSFNTGIVYNRVVFTASAQLFPDNTLSSFKNFLPEQLNLEGQVEVAISEISYPSLYQNVTAGSSCFLIKVVQRRWKLTIWNPIFTLPLTPPFKKYTITAKAVSQFKCLGPCSLQISPWCGASQYARYTIRTRISDSCLVWRRNLCSLRSFID